MAKINDKNLWTKIKRFANKVGVIGLSQVLTAYNCMKDKDTPLWAKTAIGAALTYFIAPIDTIPDITPILGLSDDFSVLGAALASVATYVKPEHKKEAKRQAKAFFD